jgi:hypothetical protein
MKGCLKIVLYGFLGLVVLGGLVTLFGPKTDNKKKTDSETVDEKVEKTDNENTNEEVKPETTTFDFSKSETLPVLLANFDSCYYWAQTMRMQSGDDLDRIKQTGNIFYNKAYQNYLDLQKEGNYDLPRNKSEVINKTMKFYAEIFNNKYASVANYSTELEFIKENLTGFPENESQIEKDFNDGTVRFIISSGAKLEIGMPKNGTWCLTDIEGGDRVY